MPRAGSWPTRQRAGLFKCGNQDIDDVTIRNLTIRNMNGKAISAFYNSCDRWTVDHVELAYNKRSAILLGNDSTFSNSFCHHNVGDVNSPDPNVNGGCYATYHSTNLLYVNNEIAYNGPEQKMFESDGINFRGNYVHHNIASGFWSDGSRTDCSLRTTSSRTTASSAFNWS